MALVKMCLESGTDIAICHVNYHQRSSSDEEEEYVRRFAKENSLPCYVRNEPFRYTGNFEASARNWRYDFFVQVVKAQGYDGVLVAHQEDDLLETYFMQEEKNLTPQVYGLQEEMRYQGVLIKRPLLRYTKKQLEEYCTRQGIRYFVDATNQDVHYARNRIRKEVVSTLTPLEKREVLQEIEKKNAVLKERRCRVRAEIQNTGVVLCRYRQMEMEDRLTLLRELHPILLHATKAHLEETDAVLMRFDDFIIPLKPLEIVQEAGRFFVHRPYVNYSYTARNLQEWMDLKATRFAVTGGETGLYALTISPDDFPLTVRNAQNGDVIQMLYGHKPVHRFFVDRKIPRYLRGTWPVVENSQGRVILVPGLGCDYEHFSINPTCNVLELHSCK